MDESCFFKSGLFHINGHTVSIIWNLVANRHELHIHMGLAQSYLHNLMEFGYSNMPKAAALLVFHCVVRTIVDYIIITIVRSYTVTSLLLSVLL